MLSCKFKGNSSIKRTSGPSGPVTIVPYSPLSIELLHSRDKPAKGETMAERDISADVKALNLGKQIKDMRLKLGLTLQNVSDRTGLSKPLLSQIENDVTLPPIATLLKISKALGKHIGDFFQQGIPAQRRIAVVRQEDRKETMRRLHEEAERIGYRYESLAYP